MDEVAAVFCFCPPVEKYEAIVLHILWASIPARTLREPASNKLVAKPKTQNSNEDVILQPCPRRNSVAHGKSKDGFAAPHRPAQVASE